LHKEHEETLDHIKFENAINSYYGKEQRLKNKATKDLPTAGTKNHAENEEVINFYCRPREKANQEILKMIKMMI